MGILGSSGCEERVFGLLIERRVKWGIDEEIGDLIFALVFGIAETEEKNPTLTTLTVKPHSCFDVSMEWREVRQSFAGLLIPTGLAN
jgi:hypothetical protein